MHNFKNFVGKIKRTISRSPLLVKLVVKFHNQTLAIIRSSLNDGIDLGTMGRGGY